MTYKAYEAPPQVLKLKKANTLGRTVSEKTVRVGIKIPVFLKPVQVQALLDAPVRLRDRVMLRLLYFCAMRISEVMGLLYEDIDVVNRVVKVCHALTPSGRPKEQKERFVPIDAETLRLIVEYSRTRYRGRATGRIMNIKIRRAQRLVKAYAKRAGLANWEQVTTHKLRHSFAVHWIMKGGDLERLRRILGHASLKTTQIYLQFRFEDVRREYDRIMSAGADSSIMSRHGKPVSMQDLYDLMLRIERRLNSQSQSEA